VIALEDEKASSVKFMPKDTQNSPEGCVYCGRDNQVVVYAMQRCSIVRCRNCSLVYLNPKPKASQISELYKYQYFNGEGEGIDDEGRPTHNYLDFYHLIGEEARYKEELKQIERFHAPGRILDIGCSTGRFLAMAKQAGWKPQGIELSESAALFAREKWGLDIVAGELTGGVFPRRSFDVITMHHVLEHLPDPKKFLAREVMPLLDVKGILVIEVPNFASLESRVNGECWQDLRPAEHLYHFTPSSLSAMVRAAGFEVISVRTKSTNWGVKPALQDLGVPYRLLRGIQAPKDWWQDITRQSEHQQSLMPFLRKCLLCCLSVPGYMTQRLGLAKRLVLIGRKPTND
jgi:2-polyprenyl-3-methyl-5-hydroxy-6-metoxy-1,4-benzoquinol methylase